MTRKVSVAGCISALALGACSSAPVTIPQELDMRLAAMNESYVFADMHAHPSRFHRANVETISADEIALYKVSRINLVVANISTDMAYSGGYENRDGSQVARGQHKPDPGQAYALTADRLARLQATVDAGIAVHAESPAAVLSAREHGKVAIMPALEGADGLDGDLENLHRMYENGLRLIQLVHFRNNELGHIQTYPWSPGGLTEFGADVVRESNRLGIVIDVAHANNETLMDVLELSAAPVVFSHGGVDGVMSQDRAVSDAEIDAIARNGGVIGIWPHGRHIETVSRMVDFMEYIIARVGADHVGIGSDLRGVSRYSRGFDDSANFWAIAEELLRRGYDDDTVGKIMGGNFFRVFSQVHEVAANQ